MNKTPRNNPKKPVSMTLDAETRSLLVLLAQSDTEGNKSAMIRKLVKEEAKRRKEAKQQ